LFTEFV